MEKLPLFKRLLLYREYWLLVKRNKDIITNIGNGLNLRTDKLNRLYTIINCPNDVRQYGLKLAERYINEYVIKVDKLVIDLNMYEYVTTRRIVQVSETDFLIVFDFKGFDTAKLIRRTITNTLLLASGLGIYFLFF